MAPVSMFPSRPNIIKRNCRPGGGQRPYEYLIPRAVLTLPSDIITVYHLGADASNSDTTDYSQYLQVKLVHEGKPYHVEYRDSGYGYYHYCFVEGEKPAEAGPTITTQPTAPTVFDPGPGFCRWGSCRRWRQGRLCRPWCCRWCCTSKSRTWSPEPTTSTA